MRDFFESDVEFIRPTTRKRLGEVEGALSPPTLFVRVGASLLAATLAVQLIATAPVGESRVRVAQSMFEEGQVREQASNSEADVVYAKTQDLSGTATAMLGLEDIDDIDDLI